jgi:hypothetical protein
MPRVKRSDPAAFHALQAVLVWWSSGSKYRRSNFCNGSTASGARSPACPAYHPRAKEASYDMPGATTGADVASCGLADRSEAELQEEENHDWG